jgi:hypothetical protein
MQSSNQDDDDDDDDDDDREPDHPLPYPIMTTVRKIFLDEAGQSAIFLGVLREYHWVSSSDSNSGCFQYLCLYKDNDWEHLTAEEVGVLLEGEATIEANVQARNWDGPLVVNSDADSDEEFLLNGPLYWPPPLLVVDLTLDSDSESESNGVVDLTLDSDSESESNGAVDLTDAEVVVPVKDAIPIKDTEEVIPVKDTEEVIPVKDAEEVIPVKDTEEVIPVKDAEDAIPLKDTEEVIPVKDTKEVIPVKNAEEDEEIEESVHTTPTNFFQALLMESEFSENSDPNLLPFYLESADKDLARLKERYSRLFPEDADQSEEGVAEIITKLKNLTLHCTSDGLMDC